MRQFILIGRNRETGKDEIICDRTVSPRKVLDRYKELARQRTNDKFVCVDLIEPVRVKSTVKFLTTAEAAARAKSESDAKPKAPTQDASNQAPTATDNESPTESNAPAGESNQEPTGEDPKSDGKKVKTKK